MERGVVLLRWGGVGGVARDRRGYGHCNGLPGCLISDDGCVGMLKYPRGFPWDLWFIHGMPRDDQDGLLFMHEDTKGCPRGFLEELRNTSMSCRQIISRAGSCEGWAGCVMMHWRWRATARGSWDGHRDGNGSPGCCLVISGLAIAPQEFAGRRTR